MWSYLAVRQGQAVGHFSGVNQAVELILHLLELLLPLAHLLPLQLLPLRPLAGPQRRPRPQLWVAVAPVGWAAATTSGAVTYARLVCRVSSKTLRCGGRAVRSVGGDGGRDGHVGVVAAVGGRRLGGRGGGGSGGGGGGGTVLQAEGLEANLVVLRQDGPHLQAVVERARHMEGHDTGGHGALADKRGGTRYSFHVFSLLPFCGPMAGSGVLRDEGKGLTSSEYPAQTTAITVQRGAYIVILSVQTHQF